MADLNLSACDLLFSNDIQYTYEKETMAMYTHGLTISYVHDLSLALCLIHKHCDLAVICLITFRSVSNFTLTVRLPLIIFFFRLHLLSLITSCGLKCPRPTLGLIIRI